MKHSSRILVLGCTAVGDNMLVVNALTPEWGRRGFLARVPAGGRMALFQPMSIVDAELSENPKSDLWRLQGASQAYPLVGIRSNLYKNSMTMFLGELLMRCIADGCGDPGLFDWCCRSVLELDALQNDFSNYHLIFLLELASVLGYAPDVQSLAPFAGTNLAELTRLLTLPKAEAMLLPLSGGVRSDIAESLLQYMSNHAGVPLNLRSLRVLRELYR